MLSRVIQSLFGKKNVPSHSLNEVDKVIVLTQQFITRTDLIQDILNSYEKAKLLPEEQKITPYCQVYFALENFIINNKPLVVQKLFTRDTLREELKRKLSLELLPLPLRIIFLPEYERILYLYESSADNLATGIITQLGRGSLQKILTSGNTLIFIPFIKQEIDFKQLHTLLLTQSPDNAIITFKTMNTLLYEEIVRSLGANTAQEVIKKNYTMIKERYEYDFISHYLEVLPEGVLERERIAYLTRDELEKRATIAAEEKVRRAMAEESAKKLQQMVDAQTHELLQEKEAIANERNKLSTVLSGITDAVIAVDDKDFIILFNTAAEHLSGMSAAEASGKYINDVITLYDSEKQILFEAYKKQDKDMLARLKKDFHIVNKNKETKYITATISPLSPESSQQNGWVMTLHDITKEQQLEDMKLDFVSMAAHELRTPLTAIRGYTALLRDEYNNKLDEAGKLYMNRLTVSTKNLAGLIDNLLNVSRIERNTFKVELAPINAEKVIKETIANIEEQARTKKQTIAYLPPDTTLSMVMGDSSRISQVMTNLLANAMNYTQEGGSITVSAKEVNGFIEIAVADNGQGIPKEALPKLFSKFFRVSGVLEQGSKGTGLGLFITKSIVELHKGTITVDSEVGKGATFRFTLPVVPTNQPQAAENAPEYLMTGQQKKGVIYNQEVYQRHIAALSGKAHPVETEKRRILLVEDDLYIRDLYKTVLEKGGYEVETAVDGKEGIEKAATEQANLVLLDIMMPKVTGIEVLRELRKEGSQNKETPVFLITNLGQESVIKEAFSLGADGYFLKSQLVPNEIAEEVNRFFTS